MSQQNLISFALSDEDRAEVMNAIKTIETKLVPKLKSLTAEEKKEIQKVGDKTYAFVEKCYEYAIANPDLVPAFLDVAEYKNDFEAFKSLRSIFNPMSQTTELIGDSMTLCGSDSMSAALVFYNSVKGAVKIGIPKSKTIYEDLSARFPGRPKKDTTTT